MRLAVAFVLSLLILACSDQTEKTSSVAPPTSAASVDSAPPGSVAPHLNGAPSIDGPKLLPVDEGSKDASFVAFRQELLAAVRARDVKAVLGAVDPKIRTSFGDGGGIAGFKKQWKIDQPDSPLWSELEEILSLGGAFQKSGDQPRFWAPYVYSSWPDEIDAFEHLAVIGKDVALRETASESAATVTSLSHDIVARAGSAGEQKPWQQVKTADGRTGWVDSKLVRSPVSYRAGLAKKDGRWWIEALVAGD